MIAFHAIFRGGRDRVTGLFPSVLRENLTEPILTDREEPGSLSTAQTEHSMRGAPPDSPLARLQIPRPEGPQPATLGL